MPRALPLTSFNRNGKVTSIGAASAFASTSVLEAPSSHEQTAAATRRRRRAAYELISGHLAESSCVDCGVRGLRSPRSSTTSATRRRTSPSLAHEAYSVHRLQAEIDRCEVVCVNCHRHRTTHRAQSWRCGRSRVDTQASDVRAAPESSPGSVICSSALAAQIAGSETSWHSTLATSATRPAT